MCETPSLVVRRLFVAVLSLASSSLMWDAARTSIFSSRRRISRVSLALFRLNKRNWNWCKEIFSQNVNIRRRRRRLLGENFSLYFFRAAMSRDSECMWINFLVLASKRKSLSEKFPSFSSASDGFLGEKRFFLRREPEIVIRKIHLFRVGCWLVAVCMANKERFLKRNEKFCFFFRRFLDSFAFALAPSRHRYFLQKPLLERIVS